MNTPMNNPEVSGSTTGCKLKKNVGGMSYRRLSQRASYCIAAKETLSLCRSADQRKAIKAFGLGLRNLLEAWMMKTEDGTHFSVTQAGRHGCNPVNPRPL
jgi:hypothetical protein